MCRIEILNGGQFQPLGIDGGLQVTKLLIRPGAFACACAVTAALPAPLMEAPGL